MPNISTTVTVRVIARDGKFLGDDIGGAYITIRDARTKRILAEGATKGGSGANGKDGVMCVSLKRGQPLPTVGASAFVAELLLDRPIQMEVTAFGPLGARASANTVSATQWVYPGKEVSGGVGFLLELPGLICQILQPPTHYSPAARGKKLAIRANVAMMCGCPIDVKAPGTICPGDAQPWLPGEFEVMAVVEEAGVEVARVPLSYVPIPPADTAGQFAGEWSSPPAGTFTITVYAYQKSTGNTGVDAVTAVLPEILDLSY